MHDNLLDIFGRRICAGVYKPCEVLKTEDLSEEFVLSRTVVREVMKVLESMGLIEARRSLGLVVLPQEHWHVFDPRIIEWRLASHDRKNQLMSLTFMRLAVEPIAASLAAQNATPEQRKRIVELATLMTETGDSGDLDQFLLHDIEFHQLLLQASGNEMFRALSTSVAAVLEGRTKHKLMPHRPNPEGQHFHRLVATCVAQGDAQASEKAMRALLEEVKEAVGNLQI
ncbi:FadR/GntR family transcriptional regulator [Brucellaceae bacterium C25G]